MDPETLAAIPADQVTMVEIPALAISSTDCRDRHRRGEPVWYLVPDGVVQYIAKHGLYPSTLEQHVTATDHAVELVVAAARAASDKLAQQIIAFDVSEQLAITDAFLLASATNDRQVRSIVDEVEDKLREIGAKPIRREGERDGRWVLIDYGEIVVHVQHEEERQFYALERLWRDCPTIPLPADVTAALTVADLVLLRHGRTDWNAARRVQGQADSQLDDLGHAPGRRGRAGARRAAARRAVVLRLATGPATPRRTSPRRRGLDADVRRPAARVLPRPPRGALPRRVRGRRARRSTPSSSAPTGTPSPGAEKHAEVADRMAAALAEIARAPCPTDGVAWSSRTAPRSAPPWPPCSAGRRRSALTLHGMDNCGWAVLRRRTPTAPLAAARLQPDRRRSTIPIESDASLLAKIPRVVRGASTLGQHLGLWRSW